MRRIGKERFRTSSPQKALTDAAQLRIRYHNGSTFQVIGSDKTICRLRRRHPEEFNCWNCVLRIRAREPVRMELLPRPILEENNGWMLAFISAPPRTQFIIRKLYKYAERTPGWFSEILTAKDTGALSPEALAEALKEYCSLYGEDFEPLDVRSRR